MLGQILTETNAITFIFWIVGILGTGLIFVIAKQINRLIENLEQLDKTVNQNNIYQLQHYNMLKEHKETLKEHSERLIKLEFSSNGKGS